MPLFAILHIDLQGLHRHSCTLVEAASLTEVAQHMLTNPDRWQAALEYSYPNDDDCRSLRIRIGADDLTPHDLLTLIGQTEPDQHLAEMLRIYPVEIQMLDQVQIKTRLLDENASQIHSSGTLPAEPTPTTTTEASPSQILSAYTALQHQKRKEITTQLQQVHDRFAQQLQAVQQQEQKFVNTQADLLNQLRHQLAIDARSLLLTPNFQDYLQVLLEQDIWRYSQLRFQLPTSDLSNWLIPTLEFPVQLVVQMNQPDEETVDVNHCIEMTVGVGLWQQNLRIPTVTINDENLNYPGAYDTEQQWLTTGQHLKQSIESEPFGFVVSPNLSSTQHSQLIMELTCLLAYVTQLFNLNHTCFTQD
ncbi:MAG: hypothetical protein KME27_20775 [Lyngbya sp. HA4199-MV5]|nr:hypothetical protein [Lyngbya sp. HA4199-MV5]